MAENDDLTGLFPDPPPPDGDRRSKAIEAALRRFDEVHAQPDGDNGAMPPASPAAPNRTRFAVLASAALVVMATVPLLMTQRFGPNSLVQAPPPSANERITAIDIAEPPPPADEAPRPAFETAPAEAAAPAAPAMIAPPVAAPPAQNLADAGPPQVVGAVPEKASPAAAAAAAAPAPAAARTSMREGSPDSAGAVVVTGSRMARPSVDQPARERRLVPTARQIRAWQACTVADERQSARRCAPKDRTAPGAAELAKGLEKSFEGDDRAALMAFDAALAAAPGSTNALLNRALVHQQLGDLDGARADFDRAIRSDPGDARNHYFRSLLLKRSGDGVSADKELRKALDLAGEEAQQR